MDVRSRLETFEVCGGLKWPESGLHHEEHPRSTITDREWIGARAVDATLASPMARHAVLAWRPGERLGGTDGARFEVLERLGGGGMSVVFLARDTMLHRMVAIKFLTSGGLDTEEALERIQLEARACARLNHENIVRLFDMGTDRGVPFLVMEHLDGRSLDAIRDSERLCAQRAVRILIDVCRGLSQAHRTGIVHRDLKPSNVFITKDGTVKILDFGVASIADMPDTGCGFAGTPAYMSPEQWKGQAQDGRTDIWAVGIMLFELLTGRSPFPTESLIGLRDAVVAAGPAPSLRQARPDLPEEAEDIVRRALQKEPGARYGTADELLYALIALEIALSRALRKRLDRSEALVRAKPDRRQITILSCSLYGVPELPGDSVLDDLHESLGEFFDVGTNVVRQLEGTLLSSIGPRIVACFGYPMVHEDHAQRALRAASLIVEAAAGCVECAGPLAVRIGIDTSVAIVNGVDRAATPRNLQGDAPRVAQWLEQRAGPNEILVGHLTQVLARGAFHLEPLGEAMLEGGARAIRMHRVLHPKQAPSRFDPVAGGALTPFVGREDELETLRGLWESAQAGKGRFALIVGEAGMGKSRLLEHHLEQTASAPRQIVRCQCWAYFRNSALQPISEALASSNLSLELESTDKETLETLVVLFTDLAKRHPTLLVVEDAHWSDDSTLEFLALLLGAMPSSRLMVIVTARPDFRAPWPHSPHLSHLALMKLSARQTAAMVAFASQGRNLPLRVVEQLVQRTDGVPLFVEELTHRVADAMGEAGSEDSGGAIDAFCNDIPATLEALLRARLDVLPQEGQDVAQLVAVLGRDATYEVIAKAWEHHEDLLRAGLMQLMEADILRHRDEGDGGSEVRYTFKHALVKDAAYHSLTKGKRRDLHRRAAEALLDDSPSMFEQNPELLGAHFMEAGCHEDAVVYFEKACERALARSANVDAAAHCRQAIAQLVRLPEGRGRDQRELTLQLALGRALLATNWSTDIHQVYARVRELGRDADGGDALPFASLLELWRFYSLAGELGLSGELEGHLMAHAEKSGNSEELLLAHFAVGMRAIIEGDFVKALEHERTARTFYDEQAHGELGHHVGVDPYVDSGVCLACALWQLGETSESLRCTDDSIRLARRKKHPFSLAWAMIHASGLYNSCGEYDKGYDLVNEAMPICEKHGFDAALAFAKVMRGWSRQGRGERDTVNEIREGITGQLQFGRATLVTLCYAVLAGAQLLEGAFDDGLHTIEDAMVLVARGERIAEPELLRIQGELLLAKGADPSCAFDLFERGLEIARRQRAKTWRLFLSHSYARGLAQLSRTAEAQARLAPVLSEFKGTFEIEEVREARAFLLTLAPPSPQAPQPQAPPPSPAR